MTRAESVIESIDTPLFSSRIASSSPLFAASPRPISPLELRELHGHGEKRALTEQSRRRVQPIRVSHDLAKSETHQSSRDLAGSESRQSHRSSTSPIRGSTPPVTTLSDSFNAITPPCRRARSGFHNVDHYRVRSPLASGRPQTSRPTSPGLCRRLFDLPRTPSRRAGLGRTTPMAHNRVSLTIRTRENIESCLVYTR